MKALCLGARAVLVGRAYAYGLGAGGGAGVAQAIEILRTDLVRTLKLLGCPSLAALDRSYVRGPRGLGALGYFALAVGFACQNSGSAAIHAFAGWPHQGRTAKTTAPGSTAAAFTASPCVRAGVSA